MCLAHICLYNICGKTDTEAEAPGGLLWPPDVKSQLIGKDPDAGKDRGKKGETEDEMVDGITDSWT